MQQLVDEYKKKNPHVDLLSLSIGDTSQPIPELITDAFTCKAKELSTEQGYQGYGPSGGEMKLRIKIAKEIYGNTISPEEIFISDGAKCDIGRLQILFGKEKRIAVQDPTYPAYVDTGLLIGQKEICYLPCLPENNFFPDLNKLNEIDLLYFCSPHNPTGGIATYEQLERLVAKAKEKKFMLIYDAAYSDYIQGDHPRSIFVIKGASEVAIEISSFSKSVGFTGIRLGWSVVPKNLKYESGESIHADWQRIITTFFNGASNLAQAGGIAALSPSGIEKKETLVAYYRENARILKESLSRFNVSGGKHAPYLWIHFPQKESWNLFEKMLYQTQIVSIPGSGFGKCGEGFLRLSAFGSREKIEKAVQALRSFQP
ncbi:MAG: LL-diaminopimelate aminotransferase [Chlamydiales bacterium]